MRRPIRSARPASGAGPPHRGVKAHRDGRFSGPSAQTLKKSDRIQVMRRQGRLTAKIGGDNAYLCWPPVPVSPPACRSPNRCWLGEPNSTVTCLTPNARNSSSVTFRDDLNDLKGSLHHPLSPCCM